MLALHRVRPLLGRRHAGPITHLPRGASLANRPRAWEPVRVLQGVALRHRWIIGILGLHNLVPLIQQDVLCACH